MAVVPVRTRLFILIRWTRVSEGCLGRIKAEDPKFQSDRRVSANI